jgi:(p)ppGpp synthase/HD superfamily hydrolase
VEQLVPYNQIYLTKDQLVKKVSPSLVGSDVNTVVSAYEMGEHIHEFQKRRDGTPYFWHLSRVAKTVIDELGLIEVDVICASLLHDALEDSDILTPQVIAFNFGLNVAYIVEILTKNLRLTGQHSIDEDRTYIDRLMSSSDECKIVKLAERLDNFRCLTFGVKRDMTGYLERTVHFYLPMAETSGNRHLKYLVKLLKEERAKMLG